MKESDIIRKLLIPALTGAAAGGLIAFILGLREASTNTAWLLAPLCGFIGSAIGWISSFLPQSTAQPLEASDRRASELVDVIESDPIDQGRDPLQAKFFSDIQSVFSDPEGSHWSQMAYWWMNTDPSYATIIRRLQIFVSSMRIAMTSKSIDTARSRMATALVLWYGDSDGESLSEAIRRIVSPDAMRQIDVYFRQMEERFKAESLINSAQGLVDSALKLKTRSGQSKRLDQARSQLDTAERCSVFDARRIASLRATIKLFDIPD